MQTQGNSASSSSQGLPADDEGIAGPLITALEHAWSTIRSSHPEVPAAVLITGSGSESGRNMLRLGHFAASRWHGAGEGDEIDEIFVGGEGLERGAAPVLATLLHEAAHALARRRGVQDTSRQGRYHNQRFKALAEELGLHIDKHPVIGWSLTTLPDATAQRYAAVIEDLERAITIYRRHEGPSGAQAPRKAGPVACMCGCGRRIRVAATVLAVGPILCGVCEQPFEPDAPDDDDAGEEVPR
jgi:hypothetical protein